MPESDRPRRSTPYGEMKAGRVAPAIDVMRRDDPQEDRSDSDGGRYVRRERRFGAFSRSIELPSGVDAQAIKAQTCDGVVEVTVPLPTGSPTQKVEITAVPASEDG